MYNTNMLKNKFYSLILFSIVTFSASFTGGLVSISLKEPRDVNTIYIYFIHIVFNATWSIVFFGLHQIFFALVVLVILITLIIILIIRFKRVNFVSYYLMIPYLLWCLYALFLNYNLMILN
jgi:benzodiazapine receptor